MSSYQNKHQFTRTNAQRRASIIYDGTGKGGLFVPSDFIRSPRESFDDVENVAGAVDSETPLLGVSARPMERRNTISYDIVHEARDILENNHLLGNLKNDDDIISAFENAIESHQITGTTYWLELRALVKSSIPLILTFLLQNSLSTVSVFSVGHLGASELAAVSIGSMTANITGYATIQGIATALDTLCPQAFGAKKYHLVGIYLQKCCAIVFVIMLPVLFLWIFYGFELISLLIPDKETVHFASQYLFYVAFGIPAYVLFECGKRFLLAQGIFHISTYVLLFAAPCNLLMNLYFVKLIGFIGAPIAVAINYWIMAIGLLIGTVYFVDASSTPSGIPPLTCWGGLNIREAFKNWDKLLRLAIPGLIMLEAEFLAFEILTLMASYLGTIALAAQSIGTTMASLTYQVPFAVGIAASTRIANFLGAGLGNAAYKATGLSLLFGLLISTFNFFFLFVFQTQIAHLFTDDVEVVNYIKRIMWLIALMQIFDAMNANSAGCLRGQGQTTVGGIVNLVSYYIVGIPLSIYLAFYSRWKGNLEGLWIGSVAALAIIGIVQSYFSINADFDKLTEDARQRNSMEVSG